MFFVSCLLGCAGLAGCFDADWEWGEKIYSKCKAKGLTTKGLCSRLQDVVEGTFERAGDMINTAFGAGNRDGNIILNEPQNIESGDKILEEFLTWAIQNSPVTEEQCITQFGMLFMPWYKDLFNQAIQIGKFNNELK